MERRFDFVRAEDRGGLTDRWLVVELGPEGGLIGGRILGVANSRELAVLAVTTLGQLEEV